MGFTPCKTEEPLGGMELQEKEEERKEKKYEKHAGKQFRKNLKIKDVD